MTNSPNRRGPNQTGPSRHTSIRRAFIAGTVVLIASAAALNGAVSMLRLHLRKLPIEVEQKVHAIPSETDHWVRIGEDRVDSAEIVEELGTKNYVNRAFKRKAPDKDGNPVVMELHLAYYTGMIDTVPHVPDRCLVGAGWSIESSPGIMPVTLKTDDWSIDREATAELASESSPIYRARLLNGLSVRMPRGVEGLGLNTSVYRYPSKDAVLAAGYFFIANGGISVTPEGVRLLAFDLRSDYAFFMKVQLTSLSAQTPEQFAEYAAHLLQELLPEIMLCVPDWVEVERGSFPPENPRRKKGTSS